MRHDDRLATLSELVVRASHSDQFPALFLEALDDLSAIRFHVYINTHKRQVSQVSCVFICASACAIPEHVRPA